MTKEQIKHMVDRFLGWKLPENFNPDGGVSFKKTFNDHLPQPMKNEPTGTNLFDATQADAMVRYMLDGLPAPATPSSGPIGGRWEIDGDPVTWDRSPRGGITLFFGVCETLNVPGEPDIERAKLAIASYEHGKRMGVGIGKAQIKSEFRSLMDLPSR